MAEGTAKAKSRLAILDASLDGLEEQLESLFSQTLPESLLALEPIQQAKLQTLIPYLVYDLIFSMMPFLCLIPSYRHPSILEIKRHRSQNTRGRSRTGMLLPLLCRRVMYLYLTGPGPRVL